MMRFASSHFRRPASGYTLVEVVIALGVLGVLMMALVALSMFTARSFQTLGDYSAMNRESSFALDSFSKDIRQAARVDSFGTNQIVFSYLDPSQPPVTYSWDPVGQVVTRQFQGISRNLLTECDAFVLQMFKRNVGGSFTYFPTDDPTQAKLISVTWQCSRPIYGLSNSMETFQSASFVLRN